jgi:hypothetical protein
MLPGIPKVVLKACPVVACAGATKNARTAIAAARMAPVARIDAAFGWLLT